VFQARGHTLKTDLQEGNWRLRSNKDWHVARIEPISSI
jgi:hypothetical protein